jgi:hypothetical protein
MPPVVRTWLRPFTASLFATPRPRYHEECHMMSYRLLISSDLIMVSLLSDRKEVKIDEEYDGIICLMEA